MINLLFSGNEKVFDGVLSCMLSIFKRTKTKEPFRIFVYTMDVTRMKPEYTAISEKMITFLDKVAKQYNYFQDVTYGSYQITGQKEDLIIDPKAAPLEVHGEMFKPGQNTFKGLPESLQNISHIINFGSFAYSIGFYMGDVYDHGGDRGAFKTVEERDEVCARGYEQLLKVVEAVDVPLFVKQMKDQAEYTNTVIKEKFGKTLPKNKFSDWV